MFQDSEVQHHARFEWNAGDHSAWPLFVVELWRVNGQHETATCEAVGAFPLPLLRGHCESSLPVFAFAQADLPPPPAEALLMAASNGHMALRCVCVLSLFVHNFSEDFDLQGTALRSTTAAYK